MRMRDEDEGSGIRDPGSSLRGRIYLKVSYPGCYRPKQIGGGEEDKALQERRVHL